MVATYKTENPNADPSEIYFLAYSDIRYVMPSITIAERRAALNSAPTFLYYLKWKTREEGRGSMSPHTLDIPFIFDNVREHPFTSGQEAAIVLADRISDTIIEFAKTGDPNTGKLPRWKPYNGQARSTLVLDNDSTLISDPIGPQRRLMQPILNL